MRIACVVLAVIVAFSPHVGAAELPHHQEIARGVHAVGFADKYGSANCGWVATGEGTVLVDLPRGLDTAAFLADVAKESGKPVHVLVLTRGGPDDAPPVAALVRGGVKKVYVSPAAHKALFAGKSSEAALPPGIIDEVSETRTIGDAATPIDVMPVDGCCPGGGIAVHVRTKKVLFAGPIVINGPRTPLVDCDTELWLAALRRLAPLQPAAVVPGRGSWGGATLVDRQIDFLSEVRRQVGYLVAQGRPRESLSEVRIPADYLVWMPYDMPTPEDVDHVYRELTVPVAPFGGRSPATDDKRDHALVLIGDQPHEPGHVEQGLRPVFEATGVAAHFTVDVRALSAENLARVRLLVILRDGLQRPEPGGKADYVWMTPEQERAVVDFVERGGAFLNLHNSMGLYPDDGPYLKLVGGRYIGHGPLERFRVEVVDRDHPVTRGVRDFSVADEQHTPPYDDQKVHLLLRNRSDDGQTAAAGWAYEPGKGRLCHLANGHTRESLLHPMYQRLMRNAVLWCLRRDVPAEGSAVDTSPKR
ncbi:MAG: ThuA domain-containing protein [Planctomycetia bacterium]|nr:ThuA domain-containing protein [Planctomycetia bacterium]